MKNEIFILLKRKLLRAKSIKNQIYILLKRKPLSAKSIKKEISILLKGKLFIFPPQRKKVHILNYLAFLYILIGMHIFERICKIYFKTKEMLKLFHYGKDS